MKTKRILCGSVIQKLIIVLPVMMIVLLAFPSCAASQKTTTVHTGIMPPPPPPPPPAQLSDSGDNVLAASKKSTMESDEEPFVVVEEMPMYPGGDEELLKYLAANVKYPEKAKMEKTQGKVIVRFCVTAKGGVDKISVLKGVAPELDAEAVRVVGSLNGFIPGKQGGKNVPVWYMVPIEFALK
jgi:TonB family protein